MILFVHIVVKHLLDVRWKGLHHFLAELPFISQSPFELQEHGAEPTVKAFIPMLTSLESPLPVLGLT